VSEDRLLRRIFGLKRDEVMKREMHNEELRNLYSSPSKILITMSRRIKCASYVA
jgi:hypothetical protein